MSEPLKSTHVRLSSEAHRVLSAIAELNDKDNAEMARLLLEKCLLGEVHALMVAADKVKRLGFSGISWDIGDAGR